MSLDWTLLLMVDAALLAGAALALVGLVLRDLRRERQAGAPPRGAGVGAPRGGCDQQRDADKKKGAA